MIRADKAGWVEEDDGLVRLPADWNRAWEMSGVFIERELMGGGGLSPCRSPVLVVGYTGLMTNQLIRNHQQEGDQQPRTDPSSTQQVHPRCLNVYLWLKIPAALFISLLQY